MDPKQNRQGERGVERSKRDEGTKGRKKRCNKVKNRTTGDMEVNSSSERFTSRVFFSLSLSLWYWSAENPIYKPMSSTWRAAAPSIENGSNPIPVPVGWPSEASMSELRSIDIRVCAFRRPAKVRALPSAAPTQPTQPTPRPGPRAQSWELQGSPRS